MSTNASPTNPSIQEARRGRIALERSRNRIDAINDDHLTSAMRRASRQLSEFHADIGFRILLRRILARLDGVVPDNLRDLYLTERTDYTWADRVAVDGPLPSAVVPAMTSLAIALHQQHARLCELAGRKLP